MDSVLGAPPEISCGLVLDEIPAVFVAKAPTITRWLSAYRLASGNFLCALFPQQVSGGALGYPDGGIAASWERGFGQNKRNFQKVMEEVMLGVRRLMVDSIAGL